MSPGMCRNGNNAIHWSSHTFILDGASAASGDPAGILGSKPAAFTVVSIPELFVVVVGTHIGLVSIHATDLSQACCQGRVKVRAHCCFTQGMCCTDLGVGLSGLRVGGKRLWWVKWPQKFCHSPIER